MKFLNYSILLLILFTGCMVSVQPDDIEMLNGYWEISTVEMESKKIKEYKVNPTVDFFKINGEGKGFRKKMQSSFTGNYTSNNQIDSISVLHVDKTFLLQTHTPLDTWSETIVKLNEEELILKNKKGVFFNYKRHYKFNLDE